MSRCTKTSTVYSLKPYTQSTTLHSTPGRLCARSTVYERTNDITYMVGRGPLGSRHSRLGTRSLCKVCLYFTLFHISAHILLFSPPAGRGPRVTRTPHMYPTTPDGVHGSTHSTTHTLARPSNVGKCPQPHVLTAPLNIYSLGLPFGKTVCFTAPSKGQAPPPSPPPASWAARPGVPSAPSTPPWGGRPAAALDRHPARRPAAAVAAPG